MSDDHDDSIIIATDGDPGGRQYMLHKVVGLDELTEVLRELTYEMKLARVQRAGGVVIHGHS